MADRIKDRYRRRSPSSPLWVKSGHLQRKTVCPLYPQERHQLRSSACLLWAKSGQSADTNGIRALGPMTDVYSTQEPPHRIDSVTITMRERSLQWLIILQSSAFIT